MANHQYLVYEGALPMNSTTIGGRIKRFRTGRGLSQEQLAERAGMSKDTIGAYEQGRRTPPTPAILALAGALGVEPSRLMDRQERLGKGDGDRGVLGVRDALLSVRDLPGLNVGNGEADPIPLDRFRGRVERAWAHYWLGDFALL